MGILPWKKHHFFVKAERRQPSICDNELSPMKIGLWVMLPKTSAVSQILTGHSKQVSTSWLWQIGSAKKRKKQKGEKGKRKNRKKKRSWINSLVGSLHPKKIKLCLTTFLLLHWCGKTAWIGLRQKSNFSSEISLKLEWLGSYHYILAERHLYFSSHFNSISYHGPFDLITVFFRV